jgi:hypothetical protein
MVTSAGVRVFDSMPAKPLHASRPGRYAVRVCVPGDLLADTVYSVDVSLSADGGDAEDVVVHSQALVFRAYSARGQSGVSRPKTVMQRSYGVIAPRLEWDWVSAPEAPAVTMPPERP